MRRLALLTLVCAGVLAALVPAATAETGLQVVEAGGGTFPERKYILTLPQERRLRPNQLRVTENGGRVSGVSIVPAASTDERELGIVLVIDATLTMRGQAIEDAVAAARAFSARRNPNQQLAVITFNSKSRVLLPFTTSEAAISKALASTPALACCTPLYDAVDTALSLLERAKIAAGSVVLLSDGADTGSSASAEQVTARARKAHARIFSVALRSPAFRRAPLEKLAAASGGAYAEAASSADLASIYRSLGDRLANEYLIGYRSLAGPGKKVTVRLRVAGVRGTAASGYRTPPLAAFSEAPFHPSFAYRLWRSPLTLLIVALLSAALLGAAVALFTRRRASGMRRRLSHFVALRPSAAEKGEGRLANRVLVGAERSLESTRWWARVKDALELADIHMPAVHVAAWTAVATVLASWLVALATVTPLALAGLAVPLAVRAFVLRRIRRKQALFADQLPDNLQVLSSALRAGHSFVGALSVVVDDAYEPSQSEFRRVVGDEQLGVPLEDALEVVVLRMDNRDLKQVALVAALQRQTGGNMAEVLDRVSETIRERAELRAMVRTLTAQGRMSRWVVSALPVVLLLVISGLNPAYVSPLFTEPAGQIALGVAAGMVVSGSLVIKRIVNIKL